jgi:hypothetical protein
MCRHRSPGPPSRCAHTPTSARSMQPPVIGRRARNRGHGARASTSAQKTWRARTTYTSWSLCAGTRAGCGCSGGVVDCAIGELCAAPCSSSFSVALTSPAVSAGSTGSSPHDGGELASNSFSACAWTQEAAPPTINNNNHAIHDTTRAAACHACLERLHDVLVRFVFRSGHACVCGCSSRRGSAASLAPAPRRCAACLHK